MKEKLEEFITKNRESFDFYEPGEKVWDKIQRGTKETIKIDFKYKTILIRVAAFFVIFIGSYYFHDFVQNRNRSGQLSLKSRIQEDIYTTPEIEETEAYYAKQVSARLVELRSYIKEFPEIEEDIHYDLNELDSVYAEIKSDLKDNVANDEVIEALIQNYRLKLKILEDLLAQLQQSQNNIEKNEVQVHEL